MNYLTQMKLRKVREGSESLKGTIPPEVVKISKLRVGDALDWEIVTGEKEIYWKVKRAK